MQQHLAKCPAHKNGLTNSENRLAAMRAADDIPQAEARPELGAA
jgi:hypothetical protein